MENHALLGLDYDLVSKHHLFYSAPEIDCESKFDCDDGESKVDYDDGSIQYSINSRERLPNLSEIHRKAYSLRQKLNAGRKNDELDHSSNEKETNRIVEEDQQSCDDYGFTDLEQAEEGNGKVDSSLVAESTTHSLNILKQKLAKERSTAANSGESKTTQVKPVVPFREAWSAQQVDVFMKEFKGLHLRKKEEVAAVEARLEAQKEIEVDLREENNKLKRENEDHHSQNQKLAALIKEMEKTAQQQKGSLQNFKKENEKSSRANRDLMRNLVKQQEMATLKESQMESKHQALETARDELALAMEGRLNKFKCLVQDLQAQSRVLEVVRDDAVQVLQDGFARQKRVTKKYKKKYLTLRQEQASMEETIKGQEQKIHHLQQESENMKLLQEAATNAASISEEVTTQLNRKSDSLLGKWKLSVKKANINRKNRSAKNV